MPRTGQGEGLQRRGRAQWLKNTPSAPKQTGQRRELPGGGGHSWAGEPRTQGVGGLRGNKASEGQSHRTQRETQGTGTESHTQGPGTDTGHRGRDRCRAWKQREGRTRRWQTHTRTRTRTRTHTHQDARTGTQGSDEGAGGAEAGPLVAGVLRCRQRRRAGGTAAREPSDPAARR